MKKIKILVVEDNDAVRQTTVDCLKSELQDIGIKSDIDEANDGGEALELCGKNHFNFILMDMIMRRMHGEEAIECIRKIDKGVNINILSGYEENEVIPRCVDNKLVNDKVFYKPVNFEQLAKYIKEKV